MQETYLVFINIYAHKYLIHRAQLLQTLNRQLRDYNSNSVDSDITVLHCKIIVKNKGGYFMDFIYWRSFL